VPSELPRGDDPPGINLSRLTAWIDSEHPGLRAGPLHASVIQGGRSNLTYRLSDGAQQWALRRPPLGHVLPTAHDMSREFRVISALHSSTVPVPRPIALCTDRDVLGDTFYLMSFVDGIVLDRPELVADRATATRATTMLVATLAALHALDPDVIGLGDFGHPDGFLPRQLTRWHQQFASSSPTGNKLEQAVAQALGDQLPTTTSTGMVHGDYRLTNVLFDHDLSRIEAVVDWEMATLGDPLTDVGLLYVYHELAGQNSVVMPKYPPEQGFLTADEMVARYGELTDLDVSQLDWYIAFGYFKLGVIAAGIHARYLQGKTIGAGFEAFGSIIDSTFDAARARLEGS
jgi:aminoglycoside phosphotransferase (APT) family kinase protein